MSVVIDANSSMLLNCRSSAVSPSLFMICCVLGDSASTWASYRLLAPRTYQLLLVADVHHSFQRLVRLARTVGYVLLMLTEQVKRLPLPRNEQPFELHVAGP